jgi:(p)ppGpp synthase/HD superfamily hydrolase
MTTQIAGLLHDTVEDTDVTLNQIEDNFGKDVRDVIEILTHNKTTPYAAYIEAIALSGNRSAILVKLADLQDNMSPERLQRLPESSVAYFTKRAQTKYGPARVRLIDALENIK